MPEDTVRTVLAGMFDQVEALIEEADRMEDHVLAAKLADVSAWILRQTNDRS